MPRSRSVRPSRKAPNQYHHGDLPHAMLQEAVRTIETRGMAALTLRRVGEQLGVSRTALYRHFADKQALLAAVAGEGFKTLRTELLAAWNSRRSGRAGLDQMGLAYVRFAVTHPWHYRVMFGGFVRGHVNQLVGGQETHAFQVLVDAIVEEQHLGLVRKGNPDQLALYVWSVVHGVAMLALDGMLPASLGAEALIQFANERLRTGIAPSGR